MGALPRRTTATTVAPACASCSRRASPLPTAAAYCRRSMTTVSVVTGANSGIGRATAIHLAGAGHEVYGTVRDFAKAEKLRTMSEAAGVEVKLVQLDVADDTSVEKGMAEIIEQAGRV